MSDSNGGDQAAAYKTVEWVAGRYGSLYGSVADMRLFSINYTTVRNDERPEKLRTELPGYTVQTWSFRTRDDAKAFAEQILRQFLDTLNAAVAGA